MIRRIAIDAMGGDHAPGCVIEGVALAISRGVAPAEELVLVGREEEIRPLLARHQVQGVDVLHAPDIVAMDESAAAAIRSKRASSLVVAMKAVADGKAAAFVSAGNTGAVVAASTLVLGRLKGVARPGIAVPVPTRKGPAVVIDVGANIYCKPEHMLHYAVMASEYARAALERPEPRVGLLNIGEEEGKGNELIQQVHTLLQSAPIHYAGFVEGQDIMAGKTDVVVCEGFVGNVILKVAEGLAEFIGSLIKGALSKHPPGPGLAQAVGESFQALDYAEYGGAPLLGVSAPVLIGHGRSSGHAIMNMIRAARSTLQHDLGAHIEERLARISREALS
ncbi:MAG TPA: phosphate acyltransferase PlsX [Planctomycetota bacterium]|nr:phosphate acyltransferase PlsX [Planctomycetota bacterium]